jgi:isochorismate pyruvate lyase
VQHAINITKVVHLRPHNLHVAGSVAKAILTERNDKRRLRSVKDAPDVILYTDGACSGNPGPGGWAAILEHPGTKQVRKLSGGEPDTTNNRMELTAVIEGLRALKTEKRLRVRLVSDSEYVIHGLTQWIDGWIANAWRRGKKAGSPPVKNVDLWQALHALTEQHDMTYEHVRGHSGHSENEECDRMAVAEIEALAHGNASESPRRRRVFTNTQWEGVVGYCRAVRAGDHIYVTGTAPVDENGNVYAAGDAYAQAKRCLEIVAEALAELGATVSQVVRTRMFVTDIRRWAEYGKAHREFFADHPPATTMVEVKSLIDPAMLIEVEVDAVCA